MEAYFGIVLLVCENKCDRLIVPVLDLRVVGGFL